MPLQSKVTEVHFANCDEEKLFVNQHILSTQTALLIVFTYCLMLLSQTAAAVLEITKEIVSPTRRADLDR